MTCNTIQYNEMVFNTLQWNRVQCKWNTIPCNTKQYNQIQYHTTQLNAIQWNTKHYNAIQLLESACSLVGPRQNFSRIIDIGIIHTSKTHAWGSMILDICIIHICIRINDQRSRIIDVCIIHTWIIPKCIIPKCIIPRCIIQICSIPTFIKIKDHGHMPHTYMHQDQWS